ncbi:MAG: hypothetical protein EPN25_15330 [Nitrospirae bacterium]|nr:MAG: hypothetical protein EPN25_15330 [Nitrospirota bacterium]
MGAKEEMERIDKGMSTLYVIWAAMFLSLAMYLFVGLYVKDTLTITLEKNVVDMLRNVLYVVSLITLVAAGFVRKLLLSVKDKSTPGAAGRASAQSDRPSALGRYSTTLIISLAMAESIGIYGLVLFFLGKNEPDLYLFILVSAAVMLVYRPKKDDIVSLAEELNKQGGDDSR